MQPVVLSPGITASESFVPEDSKLLDRVRAGDQAAWSELFHECYPKIRRVISRKLSRQMRRRCDSTDLANEVMKSLVVVINDRDFQSLPELRAYLLEKAHSKLVDEIRRTHAIKRDIEKERPLDVEEHPGGDRYEIALASADPTPSTIVSSKENYERLMTRGTPEERAILRMREEGRTNEEISKVTGVHVRKIQRVLKDLFDRFARSF